MNIPRIYSVFLFLLASQSLYAGTIPDGLSGDWSLDVEDGTPAWMSVQETNGKTVVYFRLYIGPSGPYQAIRTGDNTLQFELKKRKNSTTTKTVKAGIKDGKLDGSISHKHPDGTTQITAFNGTKIPPMPTQAPDLAKVRFGDPVTLFNGKDLNGWTPHEADKINGWSATNGLLTNATPKTDFSATGDHANLKTTAVFDDFQLHIEFLIGSQRNSGIYLRGMYEAQVVDRDSRMQGLQGVGAIFGMIEPSENAGKPGGEWQTYDITLVDRHVTVVLNGVKVIDNQPVPGPTAGAIHTNPAEPGPIYLQGDHTAVSYRNIYLSPVISREP
ncbi:MAG: DUF1080 domain-containing protein [Verrucomicrobiales bacterium]|nr:DUF1080 domain-containing protein [Verrucomicrobiales bacterium]